MPELLRLRNLMQSHRGAWLLALVLGSVTLLAVVSLLALSGWFISAAALAGLVSMGVGFDYFRPAAIIRLCAIGRTAGRYAERLSSHYAALSLLKDLRLQQFNLLTARTVRQQHSADNLQRLVSDIDQLDLFPLKVVAPWLWAGLLTLLVMLFWAFISIDLLLFAAPWLLAALLIPPLTLRKALKLARQDADLSSQRRRQLLEPLSMLTNLLLWQRWQHALKPFVQTDRQLFNLQQLQQKLVSLAVLSQQVVLAVALLALLWQGTILMSESQLAVPLLLACVLALWALFEVLTPLCHSFIALGLSLAARDRLNQQAESLMDTAANCNDMQIGAQHPISLEVKQLSARQEGAINGPVNISFSLFSGQILLVQGPSGAGKSTLLQALAGDLRYTGEIRLNGMPLLHWKLTDTLGYLPQQPDLFDLSLAQNLRLGAADATDAELWQVLDDVALAKWARSQPQRLDTLLGEYGAAISGGQARRIALARLLLTKRPLLLLDEPFAGLDNTTAQHVAQALERRQKDGVLVIVSHQQINLPLIQTLNIEQDRHDPLQVNVQSE